MSTVTKELYIVRHGETDFNRQGIVQGQGVNSSINERGKQQAAAFYEHFKETVFDKIIVSSLQRTHQTMEPFARSGYELIVHKELDEINWGIHEGKGGDPDLKNDYLRITKSWREGILHEKIPGGESPLELQTRQLKFINEILPAYTGRILICSHGRAMRSLLCTMLGKSLSEMDSFTHNNLSLYKLIQNEKGFHLEWRDYNQHLKLLKRK